MQWHRSNKLSSTCLGHAADNRALSGLRRGLESGRLGSRLHVMPWWSITVAPAAERQRLKDERQSWLTSSDVVEVPVEICATTGPLSHNSAQAEVHA